MTDLFFTLYENASVKNTRWWPNFGTFEVVIGAILTQNTKWQNVEVALCNLKNCDAINLEKIVAMPREKLAELIKPSGFYNMKAKRLQMLCAAIATDFGDFENFKDSVYREWLLSQKGVGAESADSILCYACERPEMVLDNYALKILGVLGYEFESYDEAKEFLSSLDFEKIYTKTGLSDENSVFSLYHGLIVEFCKAHLKGKIFDDFALDLYKNFN